jgi:NAD+ kinase
MSRQFTVFTHGRSSQTAPALERLISEARRRGVLLRFDAEETEKHDLQPQDGVLLDAEPIEDVELCFVLGGDGTILRALRRYGATEVPVFAINFGEIGFLATIEPEQIDEGIARAIEGRFELLKLPAIVLEKAAGAQERAFNDVAIHRKIGERVAEISYSFDGEELGSVRCDGLVVATPAGSTGYNLANGGPVMAWGVEGFVVSFIAPHSLTARALVVAPGDRLVIHNRSHEALDLALDGRPVGEMSAGGELSVSFLDQAGTIAQLPGSSFYRRLREKFGRLAR